MGNIDVEYKGGPLNGRPGFIKTEAAKTGLLLSTDEGDLYAVTDVTVTGRDGHPRRLLEYREVQPLSSVTDLASP